MEAPLAMQHRLPNPSLAFVRGVQLRTPGVPITEVRIGVSRVWEPLAWETPACRVRIDGDTAELVFDRPDNWAHFAFDIIAPRADAAPAVAPLGRLQHLEPEPDDALLRRLGDCRIAFLGTARNCAKALPASISKLRELGALFGQAEIHVYENDSSDDTGRLLDQWAGEGVLHAIREQGIAERMPLRTERLAYGRNRLLDAVLARQRWDYICWADLDGLVGDRFSTAGFLSNFQNEAAWDAVFPLSWPLYYDIWALREDQICPDDYVWDGAHRLNAALHAGKEIHAATQQLAPGRVAGWLPVRSAFGGFGLYKAALAGRGRYTGLHQGREICEHVPYHAALLAAGARLYLNPQCITHIA
jgi:hypothetical protein